MYNHEMTNIFLEKTVLHVILIQLFLSKNKGLERILIQLWNNELQYINLIPIKGYSCFLFSLKTEENCDGHWSSPVEVLIFPNCSKLWSISSHPAKTYTNFRITSIISLFIPTLNALFQIIIFTSFRRTT